MSKLTSVENNYLKALILVGCCFFMSACAHFGDAPPSPERLEGVIDVSKQLVKKQEWRKAKQLLDSAQKKAPVSPEIEQAVADVISHETQILQRAKIIELIHRSGWLVHRVQLQKHVVNSNHMNLWALIRLKRWQAQQKKVAQRLLEHGHISLAQGDYDLAKQCYTSVGQLPLPSDYEKSYQSLALSLSERGRMEPAFFDFQWRHFHALGTDQKLDLDFMSEEDTSVADHPAPAGKSDEGARKKRLVKRIVTNLEAGDVITTQKLSQRLRILKPLTEKESKLLAEVQRFVNAQGHLLDQQAEQLYGQGYIAAANGIWEALLQVDQNNLDWQNKYLRSQKVLSNLRQLRDVTIE